jgi:hypothetical protein
MVKRIDWTEFVVITICLLFAIAISLYHISYDGYLGLTDKQWGSVWAIGENGFSLTLCVIISLLTVSVVKNIFRYLFVSYFALKLVYHFSCYSRIYLLSEKTWLDIWSITLVILIIIGLIICLIKTCYNA